MLAALSSFPVHGAVPALLELGQTPLQLIDDLKVADAEDFRASSMGPYVPVELGERAVRVVAGRVKVKCTGEASVCQSAA